MTRMFCLVQQGAIPPLRMRLIEQEFSNVHAKYFNTTGAVRGIWIEMPPGQAFIACSPSSASTVQMPIPDGASLALRHRFMDEIRDLWMHLTGCNAEQLVLSVPDLAFQRKIVQANLRRTPAPYRYLGVLRIASRIVLARWRLGVAVVNANQM